MKTLLDYIIKDQKLSFFGLIVSMVNCDAGAAPRIASPTPEYIVRGAVHSRSFFYDSNGASVSPSEDVVPEVVSSFVFYRKDKNWRIDVERPDPAFPSGLMRTILPLAEGGFISIVSFPARTNIPNAKGNAHVNVYPDKFFPRDEAYGAHAIWLVFLLNELISDNVSPNGSPPFWRFITGYHDLNVASHSVISTNGSTVFWNSGHVPARDENQNLVLEGNRPRMIPLPGPLFRGFMEAEYRPSPDLLDGNLRLPKEGLLTFWSPILDLNAPEGFRMLVLSEQSIFNQTISLQPIPDLMFVPEWTNEVALVVDAREKLARNQPLTYLKRTQRLDPSLAELSKQRVKAEKMRADADVARTGAPKPIALFILAMLLLPPLIVLWPFRRSKTDLNDG